MDDTEAKLQAVLARLRANHEAKHGPGSFEHSLQKGRLIMSKKASELTEAERALLDSPPPAQRQ